MGISLIISVIKNVFKKLIQELNSRGVCKVLLDAGARTNQKNKNDGWTALHLAAIEGFRKKSNMTTFVRIDAQK